MLDIVQKFLNGLASVAVFSKIYKLAYRKRVVLQVNALVSTKSLTTGLAATCQRVVPVEKGFRRVFLIYVGELIQESLDTFLLSRVVVQFFLKGIERLSQGIAMSELVVPFHDVARSQGKIGIDYVASRYIIPYGFYNGLDAIYEVDCFSIYGF